MHAEETSAVPEWVESLLNRAERVVVGQRDSLEMMVRDKTYLLMPSRMVEGGEDFDWAKFKVMQKTQ